MKFIKTFEKFDDHPLRDIYAEINSHFPITINDFSFLFSILIEKFKIHSIYLDRLCIISDIRFKCGSIYDDSGPDTELLSRYAMMEDNDLFIPYSLYYPQTLPNDLLMVATKNRLKNIVQYRDKITIDFSLKKDDRLPQNKIKPYLIKTIDKIKALDGIETITSLNYTLLNNSIEITYKK
jgi:hypothetical protein